MTYVGGERDTDPKGRVSEPFPALPTFGQLM